MIVKMEKLFLYGLTCDNQQVLSTLQRMGCSQIAQPEDLPEYEELSKLMEHQTADMYDLEQHMSRYQTAISTLSPFAPKAGLLAWKPRVSFEKVGDKSLLSEADELCQSVEEAARTISDDKSAISREEFVQASLAPWMELDLPLEQGGTADTTLEYVILPASADIAEIEKNLQEQSLLGYVFPQSSDKDQHYILLIAYRPHHEQVWDVLRGAGATRYQFEELSGLPIECHAHSKKRIEGYEGHITQLEEELADLAERIQSLKLGYDVLAMRKDRAGAYQKLMHTDKTFLLTAWVPVDRKAELQTALEQLDCYCEFKPSAPGEQYPIKLKNNKLAEPFEVVTEMYSLPAPDSVDPNPFMALFYFIFFGMMLSDAGYGLLLVVVAIFGLKKMDLSPFARKFFTLILYGGISTGMWGALYGSWFGDLIPRVAETFFNTTVTIPMVFDPLNDPITILIMSFALGVIHLFTGMALKAYLLIKQGKPWDAVFDVFFWYGLLIGLGMLVLPGMAGTVGMYLAIASAVGLILTQGRDKKNIFLRFGSGVLSLYGITGYFSDVLSYSRILALGLATGVIANVVNTMGTLPGGNVVGAIVFILVFVFGHALNIGINALGTYVHDSRLQYVEFFGKFYESGGKPFSPLRANTKYVYVTDEEV